MERLLASCYELPSEMHVNTYKCEIKIALIYKYVAVLKNKESIKTNRTYGVRIEPFSFPQRMFILLLFF